MDSSGRTAILEKLIAHYTEISAVTELFLRVDPDEWDLLLQKRGDLIVQSQILFDQLGTVAQIDLESDPLYRHVQQLIMSAVTQDEIVSHEMEKLKSKLQEQLPVVPGRQRAATLYKLQSRSEE